MSILRKLYCLHHTNTTRKKDKPLRNICLGINTATIPNTRLVKTYYPAYAAILLYQVMLVRLFEQQTCLIELVKRGVLQALLIQFQGGLNHRLTELSRPNNTTKHLRLCIFSKEARVISDSPCHNN